MDKIGLVIAGGGGKGSYFMGVWKAIKELGIDKNIVSVSGTSVGALNAILFASDNYESGLKIWSNISSSDILYPDIKRLFGGYDFYTVATEPNLSSMISLRKLGFKYMLMLISGFTKPIFSSGIFSRTGLLKIIDDNIDLESVSKSHINMYACVFNILKFKIEYLKINGRSIEDINNILLATSAIPVVFDNVKIDGNYYCDGGVKDNVPIEPLYKEGLKTLIVVHLNKKGKLKRRKCEEYNIIEIVPSKDLGDFFAGTLDFSKRGADKRMVQGYYDAMNVFMNYKFW